MPFIAYLAAPWGSAGPLSMYEHSSILYEDSSQSDMAYTKNERIIQRCNATVRVTVNIDSVGDQWQCSII